MKRTTITQFLAFAACAVLLGALLNGCSSTKSASNVPSEEAMRIYEAVANGDFLLTINENQQSSGIPPLFDRYTLEVKGDSIFSQLPYFGRAYYVPPGEQGERIMFRTMLQDYKVGFEKKNVVRVLFAARTNSESYVFDIKIWPNQRADIYVSPQSKTSMLLLGTLNLPGEY